MVSYDDSTGKCRRFHQLRQRCRGANYHFQQRMLNSAVRSLTPVSPSHGSRSRRFRTSYPAVRPGRTLTLLAQQRDASMLLEEKKALVADSIRGVPDFPKKGILFWDITTLCLDPKAFRCCIDAFEARYNDQKIDVIAGACSLQYRLHLCSPPHMLYGLGCRI